MWTTCLLIYVILGMAIALVGLKWSIKNNEPFGFTEILITTILWPIIVVLAIKEGRS